MSRDKHQQVVLGCVRSIAATNAQTRIDLSIQYEQKSTQSSNELLTPLGTRHYIHDSEAREYMR